MKLRELDELLAERRDRRVVFLMEPVIRTAHAVIAAAVSAAREMAYAELHLPGILVDEETFCRLVMHIEDTKYPIGGMEREGTTIWFTSGFGRHAIRVVLDGKEH